MDVVCALKSLPFPEYRYPSDWEGIAEEAMEGIVRVTYGLGWVFLALAVIGRILLQTSLSERMVAMSLLPHNALQLSFLFFIIAIASSVCARGSKS